MANDRPAADKPTAVRYDAQDITVLEGLEAVRKRPGMYIGSTGVRGLHHLVYEVVDNSVDEALAGHCTRVDVTIHPDNSVTVVDDGRGIPVAIMEKEGKPAVEVVLTVLHAGGKFGDGGGYKVSGGLHGVGVSVVNALSRATARRGPPRRLRVDAGVRARRAAGRRSAEGEPRRRRRARRSRSCPTPRSSRRSSFDFATLEQRLRETAFLTRGLQISLTDERGEGRQVEFHYEGGIEDFVSLPQREQGAAPAARSSSSRASATRAPSRSRCSGTPPTRSRSSRSPTTSTRTRAARTCPASARR